MIQLYHQKILLKRKNLLKIIYNNHRNYKKIKDKNLQYNNNSETTKKSALSSNSIDKYKYLIGDKMQPSNQIQVVDKAKSPYSPLEKAFEKRTKI